MIRRWLSIVTALAVTQGTIAVADGGKSRSFGGFGLESLGSELLSATGIVSGSQADALIRAGGHVAKAASDLSEEQEYYLGRSVAATILSRYKPLSNPELNRYLTTVATTVALQSDRPEIFGGYHVMALDSNEVNALSAPGGFIFVTKGFLKLVPDEDALAALFAHEVAHIVKAHGIDAISSGNISKAMTILGKEAIESQVGGVTAAVYSAFDESVDEVVDTVVVDGYSRRQEYASDEYAAMLLKNAGYNPNGLVSMLKALGAREGASEGGWFSTHPEAADRIENLIDEKLVTDSAAPKKGQQARASRFKTAMASIRG